MQIILVGMLLSGFLGQVLDHLRIGNRSRDHIAAAGPLAQIDEAATVAAEGKILIGLENQRPARRAAQRTGFLLGHTALDNLGYQVVVMSLCDLATIELSGNQAVAVAEIVDK